MVWWGGEEKPEANLSVSPKCSRRLPASKATASGKKKNICAIQGRSIQSTRPCSALLVFFAATIAAAKKSPPRGSGEKRRVLTGAQVVRSSSLVPPARPLPLYNGCRRNRVDCACCELSARVPPFRPTLSLLNDVN